MNDKELTSIRNDPLEFLMEEKKFQMAGGIDSYVPETKGIYCLRIRNKFELPSLFSAILLKRNSDLIYIGMATNSLKTRLNQELRGIGHGTFFRSIGGVLGFRPPIGSLLNKKNQRNYKFSKSDQENIIRWINNNLLVSWIECEEDLDAIETRLIQKYTPLLNIAKNRCAVKNLSEIRAECVKIATTH